ncbi:MAG: hypothetical protein ACKOVA_11095 [Novosphingobium sp.]
MFDNGVLAEPEMAVDPANDGRHVLPDVPMARESIPYIVVLPEHGISFFTYTWVNKASEAGAALAIFGPGVGDKPIQQRLADRPVPLDMDFDDWRIYNFRMAQDLKFDRASIFWETPEATVDVTFEAFHPPYSYGADPRGCPKYCAIDRIEQAGRVRGTLRIGDRVIDVDATGHRDHSWGTRDWIPFQQYEWFVGQAGTDTAVHFWRFNALGKEHLRGYVFKDGLMSRVDTAAVDVDYDDQYLQTGYHARVTDCASRTTVIEGKVFGTYCLIPDPALSLNESGATVTIDGTKGVGWMECAWPTSYLEHIRANGPY